MADAFFGMRTSTSYSASTLSCWQLKKLHLSVCY
jgi:hypothetical protein